MRAANGNGTSDFSNEVSVVVPPNAPIILDAKSDKAGTVRVEWTDESAIEEDFEIERQIAGAPYTVVANVAAGVTAYTDSAAAGNGSVNYRIRAFDKAVGYSGYSGYAAVSTGSSR